MQKILITQSQLKNYSGSEIVTLELAEYFCAKGLNVTLLTHYLDDPIAQDLAKLSTAKIVITGTKEANEIDIGLYDLIWVHHLTLTDRIIEQLAAIPKGQRPKVVFHHMSASESLEFPILLSAENEFSDLILFNSLETRERIESMGAIFSDEKVFIFGNPAPDSFFAKKTSAKSKLSKLEKIGIISNHPPREIKEAAVILRSRGVVVDFIGRVAGGTPKRVTVDTYSEYDALVSIGKSVQYGIVNNTPVYCYDRFGGPGFLNKENYLLAMTRNFSGRGFDRKSSSQIAEELSGDVEKVFNDFHAIYKKHSDEFLLSKKIDKILKTLEDIKERSEISDFSKNSLIFHSANVNRHFPAYLMYKYKYKDIDREILRLTDLNNKLSVKSRHLDAIVNSRTYKTFMFSAAPFRIVANMVKSVITTIKIWLVELRRSYVLHHTPNIKSLFVGGLLYKLYGVRRRYFGLRVAVVSRGIHTRPTSSAWIRLFSPLTYNGHRYRLSFYSDVAELNLRSVDTCIIQRTALNSADDTENFLKSAKLAGVKIIVDVDDAFLDLDSSHPQYDEQKRWIEALRLLIDNADQLWVSTDEIKHRLGGQSEVFVNSVDDRIWSLRESKLFEGQKVKILYMGTGTHHEDFKMILKDLDRINANYRDSIELTLIGVGSGLPERPWLIKKPIPERNTIYPRFANWLLGQEQFDIGIAPLVNSTFNQSKSDIKVLDYLCCGVVPIVSDIEPYKSKSLDDFVIRVGYKEHSWYSAIEDVILNKEKYASLKESNIENIRNYLFKARSVSKMSEQMHRSLMRINNSNARDELL